MALKWSNVDLKAGKITVLKAVEEVDGQLALKTLKTRGSRRTVSLHPDTVAVLKEHRAEQRELMMKLRDRWQDEDHVFPEITIRPGLRPGRVRAPSAVSQAFRRQMEQLGHEGLRLYDLRHSHATHLLQARVPAKDVSTRLGHASTAMTLNVYAHLLPDSQEKALTALDGVLA